MTAGGLEAGSHRRRKALQPLRGSPLGSVVSGCAPGPSGERLQSYHGHSVFVQQVQVIGSNAIQERSGAFLRVLEGVEASVGDITRDNPHIANYLKLISAHSDGGPVKRPCKDPPFPHTSGTV